MRLKSTSVSQVEQIAILNRMGLPQSVDWFRTKSLTLLSLRGLVVLISLGRTMGLRY